MIDHAATEEPFLTAPPRRWTDDKRAELLLGALTCGVVLFVYVMLASIVIGAWPSFSHNGLGWFGSSGSVDQQIRAIFESTISGTDYVYSFHAWPLIWSTILITFGSVTLALVFSLLASVFIVEFAPAWMKGTLRPVVRFLASVPSVIYGLLGVLVIVPFIGNHLISEHQKASVAYIISLNGYSLMAAVVILTVMISPIMISIFSDGLRSVPRGWSEASLALGINRWRTTWKIAVRTARPAIIAGTVLAVARALGEVIMLAMVSGSVGFAPNPGDGLIFFFEPSRPLGATIIQNIENLSAPPVKSTLYAIAAVLLFSTMMLSLAGWAAKQPLKKYGVRA